MSGTGQVDCVCKYSPTYDVFSVVARGAVGQRPFAAVAGTYDIPGTGYPVNRRGFEIVKEGERANATNVLQVVSLAVECGSQLVLEAKGPDAEEALDALEKLFADNFGLDD